VAACGVPDIHLSDEPRSVAADGTGFGFGRTQLRSVTQVAAKSRNLGRSVFLKAASREEHADTYDFVSSRFWIAA